MPTCPSFSQAFQDNMTALNLPVPTTLFATVQTTLASVTSMMTVLKTVGPDATVAELIGATTKLEALSVVGSVLASAYLGAVIGSLMVATGAATSCRADSRKNVNAALAITQWAASCGLFIHPMVMTQLLRYPEVFAPGPHSYYGLRMTKTLRGIR